MTRLIVSGFTISLDGYGAGPRQSKEEPLGVGGEDLHGWLVNSRTFMRMQGRDGGETGIHEDFAAKSMTGMGAWIMGRNMFGPVRGPWPDESWRGWWGKNPPYHTPVFVLTHHARPSLEMEGLVGLFGLKSMSEELKEKIAADFRAVAADGSIAERLKATGQAINVGGPKEFADSIEEQRAIVTATAKAINYKPKN